MKFKENRKRYREETEKCNQFPLGNYQRETWLRGYKTFFMLNSVEHEILNAHRYKKYQDIHPFFKSDKPRMLFFLLTNVKMPTNVNILTFMSRKNSMLNGVEHEKSFITSGPVL